MKNFIKIFFFISIISILLSSCANDKDDKGKNFVKMIESTENGVAENSVYTYNENQIISADNSKQKIVYTYKDGFIIKIVSYNKESKLTTTVEYTYLQEKLVKVTSSEAYVVYYTHNADGTVSYEKFNVDSQNQEQKVYHGTLSFKNKNLSKDERIFDNVAANVFSSSKTTFDYDVYNNPYFSILGFDKLLDQGVLVSKNNAVRTVAETMIIDGDQTISSAKMYVTTFKYDADNYPTEQVSEASLLNSNYSKIQYLY
jgi:PBP1b-binding outer membrane lipoprotein LpoB